MVSLEILKVHKIVAAQDHSVQTTIREKKLKVNADCKQYEQNTDHLTLKYSILAKNEYS
jgi:hypothetical protein